MSPLADDPHLIITCDIYFTNRLTTTAVTIEPHTTEKRQKIVVIKRAAVVRIGVTSPYPTVVYDTTEKYKDSIIPESSLR